MMDAEAAVVSAKLPASGCRRTHAHTGHRTVAHPAAAAPTPTGRGPGGAGGVRGGARERARRDPALIALPPPSTPLTPTMATLDENMDDREAGEALLTSLKSYIEAAAASGLDLGPGLVLRRTCAAALRSSSARCTSLRRASLRHAFPFQPVGPTLTAQFSRTPTSSRSRSSPSTPRPSSRVASSSPPPVATSRYPLTCSAPAAGSARAP